MANPNNNGKKDDFDSQSYVSRIDDLDEFRKEYEGVNFFKKVQGSICESKLVEDEIKKVVWEVIKSKLIWIILTGAGLIFVDLLLRSIPSLLESVFGG